MSLEVIGNEILPNLYVKNITISQNKISITVAAFDYIDADGKIIWMSSDFINKPNVNLNLIVTSDGNTIDSVLNSTSNYTLYNLKKSLPEEASIENLNQICVFSPLSSKEVLIKNKLKNTNLENYVEINHTFDITINDFTTYNDIRCYSFFSYDIWKEEDEQFIDSSGQNKKMLSGPICSERIISNGNIVSTTNRFTIDGVGYSGPLHYHNAQYMEGPQHTDRPHRIVNSENVPNTKIAIKDYHLFFSTKPIPTQQSDSFFTDTSISIANKKIYGFFRFKTEDFFSRKRYYRFFKNSFATLNILKISDHIRMKINGESIEIKEILINHKDTNDLYFYFEKEFTDYVETTLNIEYEVVNQDNLFKKTLKKISQDSYGQRYPIYSLIASPNTTEFLSFSNPETIINYIKGYCTLFSMFYNLTQEELKKLKVFTIS